jgi:hypothetical protein
MDDVIDEEQVLENAENCNSFITPSEYHILVERRLERVKISKASGPDSIPNWLLKNF